VEYLLVFDSTHQAITMETRVKEAGLLKARLIPTPETITASCGLSLKFQATDIEQINDFLQQERFTKTAYYRIVTDGLQKTFEPLEDK